MSLSGYSGIPGNGGLRESPSMADYGSQAASLNESPVRMSQITQAAERHAKGVSYLDDRLKVLQNRLNVILRPSTPRPEANEKQAPAPPLAPFAEGLNQISSAIERMSRDVDDMLNRLEL